MNQEVKEKWITALLSGVYQQGRKVLKKGDSFCCLGVLCDISGLGHWDEDDTYIVSNHWHVGHSILPDSVREWAGLCSNSGVYKNTSLANQNDKGKTFQEIANIIKENF